MRFRSIVYTHQVCSVPPHYSLYREKPSTGEGFLISGSRSRTRTCGMVVNSHPLYQLSYPGMIDIG